MKSSDATDLLRPFQKGATELIYPLTKRKKRAKQTFRNRAQGPQLSHMEVDNLDAVLSGHEGRKMRHARPRLLRHKEFSGKDPGGPFVTLRATRCPSVSIRSVSCRVESNLKCYWLHLRAVNSLTQSDSNGSFLFVADGRARLAIAANLSPGAASPAA